MKTADEKFTAEDVLFDIRNAVQQILSANPYVGLSARDMLTPPEIFWALVRGEIERQKSK